MLAVPVLSAVAATLMFCASGTWKVVCETSVPFPTTPPAETPLALKIANSTWL